MTIREAWMAWPGPITRLAGRRRPGHELTSPGFRKKSDRRIGNGGTRPESTQGGSGLADLVAGIFFRRVLGRGGINDGPGEQICIAWALA